MENKSHALAAGLFVLAISALLVVLALWLARDSTNTVTYRMTSATGVTGLQVQAAVRYKGVPVGKVTSIGFDPVQRGNVLVSIAVRSDAPITHSTFATLAFQGVTGLSFIQLDDDGSSTEPAAMGPDGVPRLPLQPNLFGQLSDQAGPLLEKVNEAVEGMNRLLGPENQGLLTATLGEMRDAARSLNQLALDTNQTIAAQFGPGRSNIPQLVQQATATFRSLDGAGVQATRALGDVRAVTAELARGLATLTGEGGVVARLDEGATTVTQTTLPRIQNLTEEASRTIRRLDRIANTLGENPQALLYGSGPIPPGPGEPGFVAPDPRAAPTR